MSCVVYCVLCVVCRSDSSLKFRRPIFHALVLFIDENESVRRQLLRGEQDVAHNNMVVQTGVGKLRTPRATDTDPALARERYKQFKDQVYDSLQLLKQKFHVSTYHLIDRSIHCVFLWLMVIGDG